MSVDNLADPDSDLLAILGDAPADCFYCGRPLLPHVVFWQGATGYVALHGDCAHTFAVRLLFDSERLRWLEQGRSLSQAVNGPIP